MLKINDKIEYVELYSSKKINNKLLCYKIPSILYSFLKTILESSAKYIIEDMYNIEENMTEKKFKNFHKQFDEFMNNYFEQYYEGHDNHYDDLVSDELLLRNLDDFNIRDKYYFDNLDIKIKIIK